MYEDLIRTGRVDAFVVADTVIKDERIHFLLEQNFPFVSFGRAYADTDFPYVDTDGRRGVEEAVEYLISLGHQRIACAGVFGPADTGNERLVGYLQALRKAGISSRPDYIQRAEHTVEAGRTAFAHWCDLPSDEQPTAVVAVSDRRMAIGVMNEAEARGFIVGETLSVILNQRWLKAKGFFRTAFYFPSITSSVVISLIFMWMFTRGGLVNGAIHSLFPNYESVNWLDDSSGLIHNFLGLFGVNLRNAGDWARAEVFGLRGWDWISGPSVTMFMIMILNTWTTIGTMMVIFLAALQNIPGSVYEAATVDGASSWQTFRKITVPLLRPTIFFVLTLGLIGTFQVFDQIYVINKEGGPAQTTLTIAYVVFMNGFRNQSMGVAAATAILLFIIIFAFTLLQRRVVGETADT